MSVFDEVIDRRNTNSKKWDGMEASKAGSDAIAMWIADIDFRCPQPVIDAVVKKAQQGVYGYTTISEAFFDAAASWQFRRHGWRVNTADVLFVTSVNPAMFAAVRAFTNKGDKVLLQRPIYYPFLHAVEEQGRIIQNSPLKLINGRYEIDFEDLERCAADPAVKLMLLCSPHNPVGRVYTKDELTAIGYICKKHHVILFSDEIHGDFVYPGRVHTPMASICQDFANITITAVSPSKTFNLAGMRAASLIIPNEALRKGMERVLSANRSALPSAFGIEAYIAAYSFGEPYLEELLRYLEGNVSYLDSFLRAHTPQIKLIRPEGTYLMWLDCRRLAKSSAQLEALFSNKASVVLDNGQLFGEEGTGFMRMNIACPRTTLEKALRRVAAACAESDMCEKNDYII